VRFASLSVRDFRCFALARLSLGGGDVFISGANAQGKTSLLEALGLVGALRSFRTSDSRTMIRHGAREACIVCDIEQEKEGRVQVDIGLRPGGKTAAVDGNALARLCDLVGRFPSVPLCSQDMQLVRGSPGARRRFLDSMMASADPAVFEALRRYTKALKGRNNLLRGQCSDGELDAFEKPLAEAAQELVVARREAFAQLSPILEELYSGIAPEAEKPSITYKPDIEADSPEAYAKAFAQSRRKDRQRATSGAGPHLDDFELRIDGRGAREYASEGQQRTLVIALRMSQGRWLEKHTGIVPAILADDILGELDPVRKAAFWKSVDSRSQIIATGTQTPDGVAEDRHFRQVTVGEALIDDPQQDATK